jgi:hypothetical protein
MPHKFQNIIYQQSSNLYSPNPSSIFFRFAFLTGFYVNSLRSVEKKIKLDLGWFGKQGQEGRTGLPCLVCSSSIFHNSF